MNKQYFAIAKRVQNSHGIELNRAECISDFTNGKKDGLSQLTAYEKITFIEHLNIMYPSNTQDRISTPDNTMRRKIFSYFHKMGYAASKTNKIPIKRIDDWCVKHGRYHKKLNAHNPMELGYLVTQVEKYYTSYISTLE